jgi:urease accessory protein
MSPVTGQSSPTFDANRAVGRLAFGVDAFRGVTRRRNTDEAGPLRVRFPNPHSSSLEAVIVNTAGGIAGGDRLEIDISVGRGARLTAGTAAAEKVYRSHGPEAALSLKIDVQAAGNLCWLPQETILFDQAKLSRRIDIDLDPEATLVFAETQIFGRAAMGETMDGGGFVDRWRIRRGGRLVFAETTRLSGGIANKLAQPAIGKGAVSVGTVVIAPAGAAQIEAWRAVSENLRGEAAISMWNGIAVARFCAADAAALRHDLILQLTALQVKLPRLWLQ